MSAPRLPSFAIWLLSMRHSDEWREFVIGDLEEEFATRAGRSRFAARAWFWGQTIRSLTRPLPARRRQRQRRSTGGDSTMRDFLTDLRYAGWMLWRSPGFSLFAIGIMAVGIGANTAVFSIVDGVLLKPLPYPGADRIVALQTAYLSAGTTGDQVSIANYRDWRDQSASFEAAASYRGGSETPISSGDTAEYTRSATVDVDFFRVFGVQPVLGRVFTREENVPGTARVVVISYSYWRSRYGGDLGVLNRTVRAGLTERSIVGVMPPGFHFPRQTDVWGPQTTSSTSRTGHNFLAVARLKPEVSLDQARAELAAIGARLEQQYPDSNRGRSVTAVTLQDELVGDVRLTLYLVWAVVGLVLLIACANTATLMLNKATVRAREIAVRTALGATRRRLVGQLATESLVVALIAGVAGVLIAYWGTQALVALSPSEVIRRTDIGLDVRVFAVTLAVSLATSVLVGLVPALLASKASLIHSVRQTGARSVVGGSGARTRNMLVVAEIALAVVLLTGAGLLVKTLLALHRAELGFQPEHVLVTRATGVRSRPDNDVFFAQLMDRVRELPGVVAVGATSIPPGDFSNAGTGSHFINHIPEQRRDGQSPLTVMTVVAPGSFEALGIPLKQGRDFDAGDTSDRPLVAIVNEALVRASLPGQPPIGRTIHCLFDRPDPMMIVGVVADVRQRSPALPAMPECYMPYRQHSYNNATLNILIRTAGDPTALITPVRRTAADVSRDVPVAFTTMEEQVSKGLEDSRFRALLFGLFAGFAACLATAGVYGVMTYTVQQRSKEIGLRMALGASQSSVFRLVLGQGLVLAMLGLTIGLATAIAVARFLETVLFEVEQFDLSVYLGVGVLLGLVTLLAGYVPARRASVLDPAQVLKAE